MHRTQGVDYVEEGGKRRYIDPNLPAVRGTILNAESMNAIQEEICNVIEKAGLTLNTTAAADRAAAWDQLWEAITDRGIIGLDAFDSTFTGILNVLRYGINAYGSINPSEAGPCYTRIAIIPKLEYSTRLISGRITHLGGNYPLNSCGMDFMLEQRDERIVAYKQNLQVFSTPGTPDGTLYYKDTNDTIEIWAFCTARFPKITGTMIPNGHQYWNPNASSEWTATDPTGLTQFTDIAAATQSWANDKFFTLVSAEQIQWGSANLAENAVDSYVLANNAVKTENLNALAVTPAKLSTLVRPTDVLLIQPVSGIILEPGHIHKLHAGLAGSTLELDHSTLQDGAVVYIIGPSISTGVALISFTGYDGATWTMATNKSGTTTVYTIRLERLGDGLLFSGGEGAY